MIVARWWRWFIAVLAVIGVVALALSVIFSQGSHPHFAHGVSLLNDLLAIAAIVVGAFVTVFVLDGLTPRLNVRLSPQWTGDVIVVGMEVENRSRIRAVRPYVQLQVLQYDLRDCSELSGWVAFIEDKQHVDDPPPIEWHDSERGFTTTDTLYPGEVVSGSRLVSCSPGATAAQIGLRATLPPWKVEPEKPWEAAPKTPSKSLDDTETVSRSYTTTCVVVRPAPADALNALQLQQGE